MQKNTKFNKIMNIWYKFLNFCCRPDADTCMIEALLISLFEEVLLTWVMWPVGLMFGI